VNTLQDLLDPRSRAWYIKLMNSELQNNTYGLWSDPQYLNTFYPCLGLHPMFVSKRPNADCEVALDELVLRLNQSAAIGEIGLDFRDKILQNSDFDQDEIIARQIEFFENQIQLSKVYKKPLVLHIVQAHEKALQVFEMWGAPTQGGVVHAFTGSYETAIKYIDFGFHISVGEAVIFEKNQKLRTCIEKMPLDVLMLESSSPDQAAFDCEKLNYSSSLWQISAAVADIKKVTAIDIMKISTDNFKKLFSL
jgi:TatD DNase family protein